ncbi:hypothetical protein C8J57DRAFT_1547282 [Mycena rebaudengoi]|nr:hypothetical protein C8J57DRAFT_1547282 [Mycena rebaudengoi]
MAKKAPLSFSCVSRPGLPSPLSQFFRYAPCLVTAAASAGDRPLNFFFFAPAVVIRAVPNDIFTPKPRPPAPPMRRRCASTPRSDFTVFFHSLPFLCYRASRPAHPPPTLLRPPTWWSEASGVTARWLSLTTGPLSVTCFLPPPSPPAALPTALMSQPSEHAAVGFTSPSTHDEQTSPYIDDFAVEAHSDDDTNADEYDDDDDDGSAEAEARRWDALHFPARTSRRIFPTPRLQTPQQDEQQHQQEQQRQARHTQYTPEQQNDFSDFSLLSNAFGASQSRPPPTMLPNPSWLFASPSMARPNWHASGLQTPPQYAPAFGARTPYAGSPAQYQPSRPNSPFPAWMAPSSSAIAGPSAQTPTFIPDYDDNWSAFPPGAQTPTFTANYDDSPYIPPPTLPTRRQTPLFLPGSRDLTPFQPEGSMPPPPVPSCRQTPSSRDSSDRPPKKRRRLANTAARFLDVEAVVDEADDDDEEGPTQADLEFLNDDEMDDDLAHDQPAPEKTQLGRNSSLSASLSDFDVNQLRALAARFDNRSLEEEGAPFKSGAYKGRLALITIPDEEYLVVPLPDEKMRESMVRAKRSAQFIETAIERFRRGLEFGLFKVNLKQQLANKPGSKTTDFLSTSNVSRTGEELAGFDQPHPRITNMCLDEPTSAMQPGDRVTVHAGPSAGKSGYLVMVCALPGQDQNIVTIGVIREAYNKYESLMYTARDGRSVGTGLEDDLVYPPGYITNIEETVPNLGVAASNSALAESLYPAIPTITVQAAPPDSEFYVPMNCLGLDFRMGDRFRVVRSDSTTRRAGVHHMPGDFQMVPELELAGTVGSFVGIASAGGWATLRVDKDGLGPGVKLPHHSAEILSTGLGRGFRLEEYSGEIFIYVRLGLLAFEIQEDNSQLRPGTQNIQAPISSLPRSLRLVGRTVRSRLVLPESEREQNSREMTDAEKELSAVVAQNVGKRYEGQFIQVVGDHVEKTHQGMVIDDRDVLNPDGTTSILLTVQMGDNRRVRIPIEHALHVRSGLLLGEAMDPSVMGGAGEVINLPQWEKTPPHSPSSADPDWGKLSSPSPPPPLDARPPPIVDVERGSWLANRALFGKRLDVQIKQLLAEGQKGYLVIPVDSDLNVDNVNKSFVKLRLTKLLEYVLPPPCVHPLPPSGHELNLAATRVVIIGADVDGHEKHLGAYAMMVPVPTGTVRFIGGERAVTAKVRFFGGETGVFPLECLCRSTNETTMGPTVAHATIF